MVSITDSFRKNSSRTQKPRKQIKTIPLGNALMSQFDQKKIPAARMRCTERSKVLSKNKSFLTLAACTHESIPFIYTEHLFYYNPSVKW